MMFMLLTALLPPSLDLPATNNNPPMSVALGGRNSSAAYVLPVTHSLPIDNLRESLRSHARVCVDGALLDAGLSRRMLPEHLQAIEETVLASLQRLRIIRVRPRYLSWALALRRLLLPRSRRRADAACVMDEDSHDDDDNGLSLVLCDGLADGFWPERWAEEERREQKKPSISVVRGADDVGMRDVMEAIGRLRKELGSIVVVSLQGIFVSPACRIYPVSFADGRASMRDMAERPLPRSSFRPLCHGHSPRPLLHRQRTWSPLWEQAGKTQPTGRSTWS